MRILSTVAVVFATNIIDYLLGTVSIAVVSKGLSVAEYGFNSLLAAVLGFSVSVFGLGLNLYVYQKIPGLEIGARYRVVKTTLSFELLVALVGVTAVTVILRAQLAAYGVVWLFVGKSLLLICITELSRFLNLEKKITARSILALVDSRGLLLVIFIVWGIAGLTLRRLLLADVINSVIVLMGLFILVGPKRFIAAKLDFSVFREAMRFCFPLLIIDFGTFFLEIGNRYIIPLFCSIEELGYFSYAFNWMKVISRFAFLFVYIAQPFMADHYNRWRSSGEQAEYDRFTATVRVCTKYSLVTLGLCIIFFIANFEDIVLFFSKKAYLESFWIAVALIGYPFLYLLGTLATMLKVLQRQGNRALVIYVSVTVLNVAGNFALVLLFKTVGAAVATSFSYAVFAVWMYRSSSMQVSQIVMKARDAVKVAALLIGFLVANLVLERVHVPFLPRTAALLGVAAGLFFVLKIPSRADIALFR